MTVSAFYYPHRLLEHGGDCQHAVKDSTSESIAVLLIALAASEVVIIVVCKIMAWYANLVFYSQDWDDEAKPQEHKSTSPDTIAQSLHTFKYERRHYDCLSEESTCCPVCLVEFGKSLMVYFVAQSTTVDLMGGDGGGGLLLEDISTHSNASRLGLSFCSS